MSVKDVTILHEIRKSNSGNGEFARMFGGCDNEGPQSQIVCRLLCASSNETSNHFVVIVVIIVKRPKFPRKGCFDREPIHQDTGSFRHAPRNQSTSS